MLLLYGPRKGQAQYEIWVDVSDDLAAYMGSLRLMVLDDGRAMLYGRLMCESTEQNVISPPGENVYYVAAEKAANSKHFSPCKTWPKWMDENPPNIIFDQDGVGVGQSHTTRGGAAVWKCQF